MDPIAGAKAIIMVTKAIYDHAQLVQCNKAQSKRLAQRVNVISTSIEKLLKEASKRGPKASEVYAEPLAAFRVTLDDALALVQGFIDKSWIRRVVWAQSHQSKFQSIYHRLEENMQQLSLGLNIKQVLNYEEDKLDQKEDYQALMARQDEILKGNQEANAALQRLAMDDAKRHEVLAKQLQSMQLVLAQLNPTSQKNKKADISPKLLVPFFELAIDELLAEGSFGKVYLGRYREQPVAIKLVERELTVDERKEFIREVRIMKDLRSDYIVPLYAVCDEPGRACVVMKYMAQGSLRSVLDSGVDLTPSQRHPLALDVVLGLHYLHSEGIWHRDLKSANVLMDSEGRARLSDFGLSKGKSNMVSTIDKHSDALEWMAPEVVLSGGDKRAFTAEADIYSLGMVLWEIWTGKKPYVGCDDGQVYLKVSQGQRELIPETVPEVYQDVIKGCWQEDKFQRPSLIDMVQHLRTYEPPSLVKVEESTPVASNQAGFFSASSSSSRSAQGELVVVPKLPPKEVKRLYTIANDREQAKEYEEAAVWYQQAIPHGGDVKAKAQRRLGMLHLQKLKPADKEQAHILLLEAAEGGDVSAMYNVARQFEKGDGVKQNLETAREWYKKAHENKIMPPDESMRSKLDSKLELLDTLISQSRSGPSGVLAMS